MIPPLEAGICVLAALSGSVTPEGVGWEELLEAEVHGAYGCETVEVLLPLGIELAEISGRVAPADGPRYHLGHERFARTKSHRDGSRVVTVLVPDLGEGDVLFLKLARIWTHPADYTWSPGTADFAELKLPRGAAAELAGLQEDGRFVWAEQPEPGTGVRLPHPWATLASPLPTTHEQGQDLQTARAQMDSMVWIPRAFDGRDARLGDDALARGAVDDRGYARTLLALMKDGPDTAELGRWCAPGEPARPGAPEVVVAADGRVVHHPGQALEPGEVRTASGKIIPTEGNPAINRREPSPTWSSSVTIRMPGRQPLHALGEGRDGTECTTLTATWSDTSRTRTLFVPTPDGATQVHTSPPRAGTARATDDGVFAVMPTGAATLSLGWCLPATDAWGQLPWTPDSPPTGEVVFDVDHHAGRTELLWDDARTWRLAWLDGQELLASKERLARELQARVIAASYPEPALSRRLTAGARGWDLAPYLLPLLRARAVVRPLPRLDTTDVRGLQRARRQRVLTQLEAAAILSHYARHGKIRADWALIRTDTAHHGIAPVGFDDAVVRLAFEDEVRWIDLGCSTCGTWQLRPKLRGAELLSWGLDGTIPLARPLAPTELDNGLWALMGEPPLDSGRVVVEEDDEGVRWTLEGIDAVQFLERWEKEGQDWHEPGMPSQRPIRVDNLTPEADDRISSPILQLTWPTGVEYDPLAWRASNTTHTSWPSIRAWQRPYPRAEDDRGRVELGCHGEGWELRGVIAGDRIVEQLLIQSNEVTPGDYEACRVVAASGAVPAAVEQGLDAASP